MDDIRVGTALRRIRLRRNLRQEDVGRLAGVSRATVSRAERGHFGTLTIDALRRIAAGLDVRIDVLVRWRRRHRPAAERSPLPASRSRSAPVRRPARLDHSTEVSFSIYGERGVIDILAVHTTRNIVLVIELKTDTADVNELVGTIDRKRRLAVHIAREQGMVVDSSTRAAWWVIVAYGATNRRRIAAHRSMLRAAFPTDGRSIAGWLAKPDRPVRALSIWSYEHRGNVRSDLAAVRRVRRRIARSTSRASASSAGVGWAQVTRTFRG